MKINYYTIVWTVVSCLAAVLMAKLGEYFIGVEESTLLLVVLIFFYQIRSSEKWRQ